MDSIISNKRIIAFTALLAIFVAILLFNSQLHLTGFSILTSNTSTCGDGICNTSIGENCSSCPGDCGNCSTNNNESNKYTQNQTNVSANQTNSSTNQTNTTTQQNTSNNQTNISTNQTNQTNQQTNNTNQTANTTTNQTNTSTNQTNQSQTNTTTNQTGSASNTTKSSKNTETTSTISSTISGGSSGGSSNVSVTIAGGTTFIIGTPYEYCRYNDGILFNKTQAEGNFILNVEVTNNENTSSNVVLRAYLDDLSDGKNGTELNNSIFNGTNQGLMPNWGCDYNHQGCGSGSKSYTLIVGSNESKVTQHWKVERPIYDGQYRIIVVPNDDWSKNDTAYFNVTCVNETSLSDVIAYYGTSSKNSTSDCNGYIIIHGYINYTAKRNFTILLNYTFSDGSSMFSGNKTINISNTGGISLTDLVDPYPMANKSDSAYKVNVSFAVWGGRENKVLNYVLTDTNKTNNNATTNTFYQKCGLSLSVKNIASVGRNKTCRCDISPIKVEICNLNPYDVWNETVRASLCNTSGCFESCREEGIYMPYNKNNWQGSNPTNETCYNITLSNCAISNNLSDGNYNLSVEIDPDNNITYTTIDQSDPNNPKYINKTTNDSDRSDNVLNYSYVKVNCTRTLDLNITSVENISSCEGMCNGTLKLKVQTCLYIDSMNHTNVTVPINLSYNGTFIQTKNVTFTTAQTCSPNASVCKNTTFDFTLPNDNSSSGTKYNFTFKIDPNNTFNETNESNNEINYTHSKLNCSSTIDFNTTSVENIASCDSTCDGNLKLQAKTCLHIKGRKHPIFKVPLNFYFNGTLNQTKDVTFNPSHGCSLDPNATEDICSYTTFDFTLPNDNSSPGTNYSFTFKIDPNNVLSETNESNNEINYTYSKLNCNSTIDFNISSVYNNLTHNKTKMCMETVPLNVTAHLYIYGRRHPSITVPVDFYFNGTYNQTKNITFYPQGSCSSSQYGEDVISSTIFNFKMPNDAQEGYYNFTFVIDPNGTFNETNETNNNFTRQFLKQCYDFNISNLTLHPNTTYIAANTSQVNRFYNWSAVVCNSNSSSNATNVRVDFYYVDMYYNYSYSWVWGRLRPSGCYIRYSNSACGNNNGNTKNNYYAYRKINTTYVNLSTGECKTVHGFVPFPHNNTEETNWTVYAMVNPDKKYPEDNYSNNGFPIDCSSSCSATSPGCGFSCIENTTNYCNLSDYPVRATMEVKYPYDLTPSLSNPKIYDYGHTSTTRGGDDYNKGGRGICYNVNYNLTGIRANRWFSERPVNNVSLALSHNGTLLSETFTNISRCGNNNPYGCCDNPQYKETTIQFNYPYSEGVGKKVNLTLEIDRENKHIEYNETNNKVNYSVFVYPSFNDGGACCVDVEKAGDLSFECRGVKDNNVAFCPPGDNITAYIKLRSRNKGIGQVLLACYTIITTNGSNKRILSATKIVNITDPVYAHEYNCTFVPNTTDNDTFKIEVVPLDIYFPNMTNCVSIDSNCGFNITDQVPSCVNPLAPDRSVSDPNKTINNTKSTIEISAKYPDISISYNRMWGKYYFGPGSNWPAYDKKNTSLNSSCILFKRNDRVLDYASSGITTKADVADIKGLGVNIAYNTSDGYSLIKYPRYDLRNTTLLKGKSTHWVCCSRDYRYCCHYCYSGDSDSELCLSTIPTYYHYDNWWWFAGFARDSCPGYDIPAFKLLTPGFINIKGTKMPINRDGTNAVNYSWQVVYPNGTAVTICRHNITLGLDDDNITAVPLPLLIYNVPGKTNVTYDNSSGDQIVSVCTNISNCAGNNTKTYNLTEYDPDICVFNYTGGSTDCLPHWRLVIDNISHEPSVSNNIWDQEINNAGSCHGANPTNIFVGTYVGSFANPFVEKVIWPNKICPGGKSNTEIKVTICNNGLSFIGSEDAYGVPVALVATHKRCCTSCDGSSSDCVDCSSPPIKQSDIKFIPKIPARKCENISFTIDNTNDLPEKTNVSFSVVVDPFHTSFYDADRGDDVKKGKILIDCSSDFELRSWDIYPKKVCNNAWLLGVANIYLDSEASIKKAKLMAKIYNSSSGENFTSTTSSIKGCYPSNCNKSIYHNKVLVGREIRGTSFKAPNEAGNYTAEVWIDPPEYYENLNSFGGSGTYNYNGSIQETNESNNNKKQALEVITCYQNAYPHGYTILGADKCSDNKTFCMTNQTINVTIYNRGSNRNANITIKIYHKNANGTPTLEATKSKNVNLLGYGKKNGTDRENYVLFNYSFANIEPYYMEVDILNTTDEDSYSDNYETYSNPLYYAINCSGGPDLRIINVTYYKNNTGCENWFNVTVENRGAVEATNVSINLTASKSTLSKHYDSLGNVSGNSNKTFTLLWLGGDNNVSVSFKVSTEGDLDESNNNYCGKSLLVNSSACSIGHSCEKNYQCESRYCNSSGTCDVSNYCYADFDNDGFGNKDSYINNTNNGTCPNGFVNNSQDCNDNNASIHPNATETCNGVDDNCNGQIDEGFDNDNDGFTSCGGDCNDNNASIHPNATEIPNDGIDENCDGHDNIVCYADLDKDGYTNNSNIVYVNTINATCPANYTNKSTAQDCDDSNASIHPGAPETCNGVDDNCNNQIDEGNACPKKPRPTPSPQPTSNQSNGSSPNPPEPSPGCKNHCNNGTCDPGCGETATTCPNDCANKIKYTAPKEICLWTPFSINIIKPDETQANLYYKTCNISSGKCSWRHLNSTYGLIFGKLFKATDNRTVEFMINTTNKTFIPNNVTFNISFIACVCNYDNKCEKGETTATCCEDCGSYCGDEACNCGETSQNCPQDCVSKGTMCGDGVCNGSESCLSCVADCGKCSPQIEIGPGTIWSNGKPIGNTLFCGDGLCTSSESCETCPSDCGVCDKPHCGDGKCSPNIGETCKTCMRDCGPCPIGPYCGDGVCQSNEKCDECLYDCGHCPIISSFQGCLCRYNSCSWCWLVVLITGITLSFLTFLATQLRNRVPSPENSKIDNLKLYFMKLFNKDTTPPTKIDKLRNYLSKALDSGERIIYSTKYSLDELVPVFIKRGWSSEDVVKAMNGFKNGFKYSNDYLQILSSILVFALFLGLTIAILLGKICCPFFVLFCDITSWIYLLLILPSVLLVFLVSHIKYRVPDVDNTTLEELSEYLAKTLKKDEIAKDNLTIKEKIDNVITKLTNIIFRKSKYENIVPLLTKEGWSLSQIEKARKMITKLKNDYLPFASALATLLLLSLLPLVFKLCDILWLPLLIIIPATLFLAYAQHKIKIEKEKIARNITEKEAISRAVEALAKQGVDVESTDLKAEKIDYQGHQFWRVLTGDKSHEVILDLKGKVLRVI